MVILTKKTFEDVVGGFQKLTECEFRREHETPLRLLFFLGAFGVFAGGSIYSNYIVHIYEHGNLNLQAVFQNYGFGAPGGSVALV